MSGVRISPKVTKIPAHERARSWAGILLIFHVRLFLKKRKYFLNKNWKWATRSWAPVHERVVFLISQVVTTRSRAGSFLKVLNGGHPRGLLVVAQFFFPGGGFKSIFFPASSRFSSDLGRWKSGPGRVGKTDFWAGFLYNYGDFQHRYFCFVLHVHLLTYCHDWFVWFAHISVELKQIVC